MLYKIKDIGEDGLAVDVPLTAAWLAAEVPDLNGRPGLAGLSVRGTLQRTGEDFLFRARMRGVVETTCVRCLEPARVPLDEEITLTFLPKSSARRDDVDPDDDVADEENDVDVAYFSGDEINLGPEIHDHFMLAFPPNPVCSESCAGLCAVCGGNRNQIPCDCEAKQRRAQSTLAELAKLKI